MAADDELRREQEEAPSPESAEGAPAGEPGGPESVEGAREAPPGEPEEAVGSGEGEDERSRLRRERDELRDTLQRVQAEFENFRKRTMRDQAARFERANDELVESLLPVLDSFELAVLNIEEDELDESSAKLRKGVELVYAELLGVLEKAGLERVEAEGRPFDPEEHEAVLREGDGDAVTEVMRTGYRLRGRVLRPAMVKVGGRPEEG